MLDCDTIFTVVSFTFCIIAVIVPRILLIEIVGLGKVPVPVNVNVNVNDNANVNVDVNVDVNVTVTVTVTVTVNVNVNAKVNDNFHVNDRANLKLNVDADADFLTFETGQATFASNVNVKANTFITYSDATLKKDIKPLDNALDKVMSMRGVSYEFKQGNDNAEAAAHREVGFLAQEMKQSVPEVVYGNGDGNLGIDYAKLTSVLVEAVKSQQGQIEELRAALLKKIK